MSKRRILGALAALFALACVVAGGTFAYYANVLRRSKFVLDDEGA